MSTETLLTAEQFLQMPEMRSRRELVRGKVIRMSPVDATHGWRRFNIGLLLGEFVRANKCGRVSGGEVAIPTGSAPDTVRAADVVFFSYSRWPKDSPEAGYASLIPEVVFEIRSKNDRGNEIIQKTGEYLAAGVEVMAIVDPLARSVNVFRQDDSPCVLSEEDELFLPEVPPGWRIKVKEFFED